MALSSAQLLDGLNPPQREAVCQTEGPVLVLAGAGSGKTRVITRRVAYLLAQGLAEPGEVLAVTFTNKAANEMRERVAELVGKTQAKDLVICTFHSFCLQVLRKEIEHLGYRRNFTISGESDVRTMLRRVVDEIDSGESFSPASFQAAISLCKNSSEVPDPESPRMGASETEQKYQAHLGEVYTQYQSALRAANSVDFDDLLLLTLRLWREHAFVHERYRRKFRYVMVDEYQDTNKVQYALLRMLVDGHRNFCVVGDDDQSIYAWRGADSQNILQFEKHFPGAKIVTLDQNYRSTTTILEAANSVIRHNHTRREKKLWSDLGRGRPLDWIITGDEEAEAKQAVAWLRKIQEKTGARHSDFALLYRSNLQSRPLEITFRQAGIPYVVLGGQDFFERAEVKDIISYLKIIANPRDEAAFLRVVNMPRRGIGDGTLHLAHDLCRQEKLSLGQAMDALMQRGLVSAKVQAGIRQFLGLLTHFRKRFREKDGTLEAITGDLVKGIGYYGELERVCKSPQQALSRMQNVESVVKAIGEYEGQSEAPSLSNFLDESHLNTNQDRYSKQERRQKGVTLMTIHSAKGLEFPFVFLMGIEEGLLPHEKSVRENTLEEERRLFYVALTRGRRHVTLFEALSRVRNGKERMTSTSRFMKEVPEHLLQRRVLAVREMVEARVAPPKPPRKTRARRKPAC